VLWSAPVVVPGVRGAGRSSSPTWWTSTTCSRSPTVARTRTATFNRCVMTATWSRQVRTFRPCPCPADVHQPGTNGQERDPQPRNGVVWDVVHAHIDSIGVEFECMGP
jgi:hypothetical protein